MTKQHILEEMRRTAKANDGVPLGHRRFYSETGIKYSDWLDEDKATPEEIGFVYLLKASKFYKIGRSNALGRRERELAIQLPEKATPCM
jgi:hypothetical protein